MDWFNTTLMHEHLLVTNNVALAWLCSILINPAFWFFVIMCLLILVLKKRTPKEV
jgi:hypothetical protein